MRWPDTMRNTARPLTSMPATDKCISRRTLQLPPELLWNILSDCIGYNIHERLMGVPTTWDAVYALSLVSKSFHQIICKLCNIAFGPIESKSKRQVVSRIADTNLS